LEFRLCLELLSLCAVVLFSLLFFDLALELLELIYRHFATTEFGLFELLFHMIISDFTPQFLLL